jgi:hypothetical protein
MRRETRSLQRPARSKWPNRAGPGVRKGTPPQNESAMPTVLMVNPTPFQLVNIYTVGNLKPSNCHLLTLTFDKLLAASIQKPTPVWRDSATFICVFCGYCQIESPIVPLRTTTATSCRRQARFGLPKASQSAAAHFAGVLVSNDASESSTLAVRKRACNRAESVSDRSLIERSRGGCKPCSVRESVRGI